MSYYPLSDHKLTQLADTSNAATTHFERLQLIEQARRANRLAEYLASALSEPSVRLEMLSFNMGVETINALAAYQGREGET